MVGTPAAEDRAAEKKVSRFAILSAPCPRDAAEIRYVADQAFDRHAARRPIVTVETLRQLQQLLDRVRAPLRNQAVPPACERDQRDQIGP